jgi:hypothetical protein
LRQLKEGKMKKFLLCKQLRHDIKSLDTSQMVDSRKFLKGRSVMRLTLNGGHNPVKGMVSAKRLQKIAKTAFWGGPTHVQYF